MELLSLISRLSPSKQRLIRELVWNLSQLEVLTIPQDHDARLDYHELTHQWLQHLVSRGLSPATIRGYKGDITRLLAAYPHPTQLEIEAHLAKVVAIGRSPGTVDRIIDASRSFFGFLAKRRITSTNPSDELCRPRQPKQPRKPATEAQVQALLSIPKDIKHQVILLLLADCGLRVAEVATARISETDTCQRWIAVIGKGRKPRRVPMSSFTASGLRVYIDELLHRGYTGDWLFPGYKEGRPIIADTITDYLQKLCERHSIGHVTPHQLRHYFATHMLRSGANLKSVSAMLGHADVSTTANVYWHILEEEEITQQHEQYGPMKGASPAETLGE